MLLWHSACWYHHMLHCCLTAVCISNLEHWLWWRSWFCAKVDACGACGGDGSSCNNTFVKRLTQFGEFAQTFEAKSQSCVAHRQGCNAVDTCGALEECGHPVCFVCLSRLHRTTVITASEIATLCVMESVVADVKDCGTSAVTPFMWTPTAWCRLPWWVHHPVSATSIQITEEPFNPNVYLGECMWSEGLPYIQLHACLHKTLAGQSFSSSSLLPGAAVTTGAAPPLNGGLSVVTSATFQAGGAVWTYTRTVDSETLECAGPLSTSVHIQVSDALLRCHNTVM